MHHHEVIHGDGFILHYPRRQEPTVIQPITALPKLRNVFQVSARWLEVLGIEDVGGNVFRIRFNGIPNRTYTIQYATSSSGPWQTLGTATADGSGVVTFEDHAGSSSRFFSESGSMEG